MISLEVNYTLRDLHLVARGHYFIELYFNELRMCPESEPFEIYGQLEKRHIQILGHSRYPTYQSFLKAKNRYLKKGQKSN